jgi:hypothetical protein
MDCESWRPSLNVSQAAELKEASRFSLPCQQARYLHDAAQDMLKFA